MQEPTTTLRPSGPQDQDVELDRPQNPHGRKMKFAFASGTRPLDGYTIKRGIGIGGFGEVYFAMSDAGKEVALKKIQRNLDIELRGVRQCLNLKHINLIALWDIRYDDNGEAWVIMEYVSGESLRDVVDRNPNGMPIEQIHRWFKEIGFGVKYLHDHGIVHRDLKPGNIFLDEDVIKIGDYGLSKFISCGQRSGHTESVGTFHYMAPEIGKGVYGKEIDIYALGIILFEMITGEVPFEGESSQEIIMKHLTANPELGHVGQPYRGVIAKALAKDPSARYRCVSEMLAGLPLGIDSLNSNHTTPTANKVATPNGPLVIGPDTEPETLFIRDDDDDREINLGEVRQVLNSHRTSHPGRPAQRSVRTTTPLAPTAAPQNQKQSVARPRRPQRPAKREVLYRYLRSRPQSDRLAELTGSFMTAVIACAVVCLLVLAFTAEEFENSTRWWSYFTWMAFTSIGGAWLILSAGKLWEGSEGDHVQRRFVMLVAGLLLAGFAFFLSDFALMTSWPKHIPTHLQEMYSDGVPKLPAYLMYFGTLFVALRWWKQTDPMRDARFSVYDTLVCGLAAFILFLLWQFPAWAIAIAVAISIAVQISAPWISLKQRNEIYDQVQQ